MSAQDILPSSPQASPSTASVPTPSLVPSASFAPWIEELRWDERGLLPAIAQEQISGDVLMLAWMDRQALEKTAQLGRAVYFSRSRQRLWFKGEESGHIQSVHEIRTDCDRDVILLSVTQHGHTPSIACHTGRHSCFYSALSLNQQEQKWEENAPVLKDPSSIYQNNGNNNNTNDVLNRIAQVISSRAPKNGGDPSTSYVARLLSKGPDAFLKKIGEEASEVILAGKDAQQENSLERQKALLYEVADLWFHSLVALEHYGLTPEQVLEELARREGIGGLVEKAARKTS